MTRQHQVNKELSRNKSLDFRLWDSLNQSFPQTKVMIYFQTVPNAKYAGKEGKCMSRGKISLKAKITIVAIVLFIVSFATMVLMILHFMDNLIAENIIAQFINEDKQLAKQVSIILEKGGDMQELQSYVEDCAATNEHFAYVVVIDRTVTAIAHSDVEKIGKNYLDDTSYTVPAAQKGVVMTSQFWADVQNA